MKRLTTLFTTTALALGMLACGHSSQDRRPGSTSAAASQPKLDRDNDGDNNDDDAHVLDYGHAPTAIERNQLATLVSSYYRAAAAGNGAKACALLMPFVAESVAENLGHQPNLRGTTCTVVMSKLFKSRHTLIANESASLKFYAVRVNGDKALTILSFANLPEVRQLTERRERYGTWRVLELSDGIVE